MTPDTTALERLLGQVFDDCQEGLREEIGPIEYERRRHDFVFHMLDWKADLRGLTQLIENPENQEVESSSRFLIGFLYHVIPHLNAAGRLLLDHVPDPFAEAGSEKTLPRLTCRMATVQGVIHGKIIEVEREPGLPDGQQVEVTVMPFPKEQSGRLPPGEGLLRAFGAWSEDTEELDEFLEWNRQQRTLGRREIEG